MAQKTRSHNGTKKDMALSILEAYERGELMPEQTFKKALTRLAANRKETLQKYLDYIEAGDDIILDAAFCIAAGTGIMLKYA